MFELQLAADFLFNSLVAVRLQFKLKRIWLPKSIGLKNPKFLVL